MDADFSERQLHPERWLLGQTNGEENNCNNSHTPITVDFNADADFLGQNSPLLTKAFNFDPKLTNSLCDEIDSMECSSIRVESFSRMEDQYIEHERAEPLRASFQMVTEMLQNTSQPADVNQQQSVLQQLKPLAQPQPQPPTQSHIQLQQQPRPTHEMHQQQQQLKQILLLRAQGSLQQQQLLQQQQQQLLQRQQQQQQQQQQLQQQQQQQQQLQQQQQQEQQLQQQQQQLVQQQPPQQPPQQQQQQHHLQQQPPQQPPQLQHQQLQQQPPQQQQHQQQQQQQQQQQPHSSQPQEQQDQRVQNLVQMLQQPLPDGQIHHAMMLANHHVQPSTTIIPQLPNSTPASHSQMYSSTTTHTSQAIQNCAVSNGDVPNGMVDLKTTALPNVLARVSPDSTTQTPVKRGRGRPRKKISSEAQSTVTPMPPSCSRMPSHDVLPLPSDYAVRVRVFYRTITVKDFEMCNPQGCLIYHNRPVPGDLTEVEQINLPQLTPFDAETVSEKQLSYTNQILSVIEKGVRIQIDDKGNIYATRHCRSKVFWWNTITSADISDEMKRDATVKIFNNEDFNEKMKQFTGMDSFKCLKPGIVLTFAQRWSKFDTNLNAHLIYAIITPLKAERMLTFLMEAKQGETPQSLDRSLNSGHFAISHE